MSGTDPDPGCIDAAIVAAGACISEDSDLRPKVGAALALHGALLDTAYRGELGAGEHAEYTLLQRKLIDYDLRGSTLYTTLEPCTTRNHPKRPCATWVIDRGIVRVVIGMLDPNPVVYERGVSMLRAAGILVDFFPAERRRQLLEMNRPFVGQFSASPALAGTATFNHCHNNGRFVIGHGELTFATKWSNASNTAVHVYTDGTGLQGLGLVTSARRFSDIRDAGVYDMSSRVQTPRVGEFVVLKNGSGHFAVMRIASVRARSHGDPFDAVTIDYRINFDGGPAFVD